MNRFSGFPEDTTRFLSELERNNDRAWFEEHRQRYDAVWRAPATLLVNALGPKLRQLTPRLKFEAKYDRSLVRIHQDMRFQGRGRWAGPYKIYFELRFWEGTRQQPAFWVRVFSTSVVVFAGVPTFDPPLRRKYRRAVMGAAGEQLEQVALKLDDAGFPIIGNRYAVPLGVRADHPRMRWLKHDGIFAMQHRNRPHVLRSARFLDFCVDRYRAVLPLRQWLVRLTG